MTTARRVKAISMGWCISCHEKDHRIDAVSQETSHGPAIVGNVTNKRQRHPKHVGGSS